jgi:hypothetical protein
LALGFVPLGISIILWEYFLRKARSDEKIEYVNNELTNALSARLSKLDSLESHGLIAIRPTVSNVELKEFITKAKRRLFILTPWLGFVEPTVLEQIFKEKASIKGFSLKIILLHPDSMFLKKRAEVVFGSGTSGDYQSKKTLLILRNAFRLIQSNLVEVRRYDSLRPFLSFNAMIEPCWVCISTRERLLRIHISKFAF